VRGLLASLALLGVLTQGRAALADAQRIAFVDGDATLSSAIETTLASWRIEVASVSAPADGITVVNAPDVAREHQVGAVVWISVADDHAMIWVFDARADRIVAQRIIAVPPFDEPGAAGVALTLKTLLRHSAVAPEPERLRPAVVAKPAPRVLVQPPIVTPPEPRESRLAAAALVGVRLMRSELEPRLGLSLMWTPLGERVRLGPMIGFHAGTGIAVDEADFAGHFSDVVGFVGVASKIALAPSVAAIASAAGVGHRTSLDGRVPSIGQQVTDARFNLGVLSSVGAELRVSERLAVALLAEAEWQTRRQRYTVFGESVLDLPRFLVGMGLAVRIAL
jgi:hypothetical protein